MPGREKLERPLIGDTNSGKDQQQRIERDREFIENAKKQEELEKKREKQQKKLDLELNKELQIAKDNFNTLLGQMDDRRKDLIKRGHGAYVICANGEGKYVRKYEEYGKYVEAVKAVELLTETLRRQAEIFFQEATNQKKYEAFKQACDEAIETAEPTLKEHRGWRRLLVNTGLAIAGLGVFYLLAIAIHSRITTPKRWLFFDRPKSLETLHKLKESLPDLNPETVRARMVKKTVS